MVHYNVTSGQRFMAFIIDYIIISVVSGLITSVIPQYNEKYNNLIEIYMAIMEDASILENDEIILGFFKNALFILGIASAILGVIYLLYFVVLPLFWSKQTIGRLVFNIRVVKNDNCQKPTIGNLLLREIVAGFIIYNFLSSIILIVNIFVCMNGGRSIADSIGKTRLVYARALEVNNEMNNSNDYIEAEFKEVNSLDDESNKDSNEEEEYRVF